MTTREQLLNLLNRQFQNKNLVKHMLAVEAAMLALYDFFKQQQPDKVNESRQEWGWAGLLHDLDYQDGIPLERHGLETAKILAAANLNVPTTVLQAIAAHNWKHTQRMPKSLMEWSLFASDELTGLIVAATLVLPSRKLADLKVANVLNRFKEKSFARGVNRDDIRLGASRLGLALEELVALVLSAMQSISRELGL